MAGAALVAAFAVPYRRSTEAPRPPVVALLGRLDGAARLTRLVGTDGKVRWQSTTTVSLPPTVVGALPDAVGRAIGARLGPGAAADLRERGRLEGAAVYRDQVVERQADGTVALRSSISMLDEQGLALVASLDADGSATAYDPPLEILPRDPRRGTAWRSRGKVAGATTYQYRAEVVAERRRDPGLGGRARCVQVRSTLHVQRPDGPFEQRSEEWFCEGLGSSSYVADTPDGRERGRLVSIDGLGALAIPPAPAAASPTEVPRLGEQRWERSSVAASLAGAVTATPSMLPAVIDAPGAQGGLLVATEASPAIQELRTDPGQGPVRGWTAAMGDVAYGSPLVDRAHQRTYTGAADGEVRAFTTDGLFLWSVDVGDNVATRPALGDGLLVVGSEDGHVVGLDARTGRGSGGRHRRTGWWVGPSSTVGWWSGATTAWSEPSTPRTAGWRGPPTSVRPSRRPSPPSAPTPSRWRATALRCAWGPTARPGGPWPPASPCGPSRCVDHGRVLVVVVASCAPSTWADGLEAWRRTGGMVGPWLASGAVRRRWPPPTAGPSWRWTRGSRPWSGGGPRRRGRLRQRAGMAIVPVVGAGVLVLVRTPRAGSSGSPAAARCSARAPSWALSAAAAALEACSSRPARSATGAAPGLLGSGGEVLRLDPSSGQVDQTGTVDLQGGALKVSAIAARASPTPGTQGTVAAFSLPDGAVRWRADLGRGGASPVLAGDRLVASEDEGRHHLSAFDADGSPAWHHATGKAPVPGAMFTPVVVADDLVVTGDPARRTPWATVHRRGPRRR
ncbi:MAG: PQQ-binding-like beta-propeller repeat protein [Acidimicrobiales bacterium]